MRSVCHAVQAQMGVPVRVLDPTEGSPASVVAEHVVGGFRDADAIQSFAAGLDILTGVHHSRRP